MNEETTIIAPATVPGSGAISLLRISGPKALSVCDQLIEFRSGNACSSPGGRVKFGAIHSSDGTLLDEVLVCIYKAPHSYTGEDSAEIMCHASSYIVSEILRLALERGCTLARPGEFTRRAFLSGKMDLSEAEAVADLIASGTEASHRVAMNQMKGGFSAELSSLREQMLKMATLMELELDFSEEDVEFVSRKQMDSLLSEVLERVEELCRSFRLGNAIKNGVSVVIAGAANAGKSTLLNRILGEQRAIVSDIAGTTRDTVEECLNVDGILFRFIDTAGIRETSGEIEKIGIERSIASARKADIVILLLDAVTLSSGSNSDLDAIKALLQVVDPSIQKVYFAVNKCDTVAENTDNKNVNITNIVVNCLGKELIESFGGSISLISAKNGSGVPELLSIVASEQKKRLLSASDSSVLVTNLRHYETLLTASKHLLNIRKNLSNFLPTDLLAEDLRAAISTLGEITGEISTDEVLGEIFGKFCIGK